MVGPLSSSSTVSTGTAAEVSWEGVPGVAGAATGPGTAAAASSERGEEGVVGTAAWTAAGTAATEEMSEAVSGRGGACVSSASIGSDSTKLRNGFRKKR